MGIGWMASPGQLVRKFSELLDIAEATIVLHDRNLVVAGLRSKSGRGNSAARVTARDAAHLLVAILGSSHVKDSAETVRRYNETRIFKNLTPGYEDSAVAALRNLPSDHSFVDAVEALVAAAADGSLEGDTYTELSDVGGVKIGSLAMIEITVQTPWQIADISIRGAVFTTDVRYTLLGPFDRSKPLRPSAEELAAWKLKVNQYYGSSDLFQYRRVTDKTIFALGEMIRG
jgi:hypothetical protein